MTADPFLVLLIAAMLASCASLACAGTDFARYQALADHNPFLVVETEQDLYLSSAGRYGVWEWVTVKSRTDTKVGEWLELGDPPSDGYKLLSIAWSLERGKTSALVQVHDRTLKLFLNPPPIDPATD